ncbi:MAG TPA: CRISPR-associated endonuclease Cas1 [Anaerolineae bacterium]|nr:CRISPR-associated endonuclease Cas1 [Anaerolineae bacterium]HXK44193.1 CRISPR-associated endonuclease Cas1 [Anaerolineae bacterium]
MDTANLIIDQFGSYLGKHSERLQVKLKGELLAEAPLLTLENVLIIGRGVSISTDALDLCAEQGIPVYCLSSRGEPYAALYAAGLGGTVQTRRAQYEAYKDPRGAALAAAFATGKLQNQARLLKYAAKNRKEKDPACYAALHAAAKQVTAHLRPVQEWLTSVTDLNSETRRAELLSIEGRAAQAYWEGVRALVPEALGWPGREGRGARDPFNAALNYGYGVLYGQVERAILLAGLDPYAGFIHVDRPGKPSLVLDLIEEFRAPVVDRVILGLMGQGVALAQDEEGRLILETRRTIAERVLARLEESSERYEGKKQKLRWILQSQARHLAAYLRGERPDYQAFVMGW